MLNSIIQKTVICQEQGERDQGMASGKFSNSKPISYPWQILWYQTQESPNQEF